MRRLAIRASLVVPYVPVLLMAGAKVQRARAP